MKWVKDLFSRREPTQEVIDRLISFQCSLGNNELFYRIGRRVYVLNILTLDLTPDYEATQLFKSYNLDTYIPEL